ncbi:MAG: hypothetical protein RMK29_21025 [Myxococcales bacterium]|nr:hypothetical protein [Myxococcota bacterium]MDW8284197.1 hypothetical protein [Myxococcales bacterium]
MSDQRHLRNYLLDRDFQLRHALLLAGISAVLTLGLGAVVHHYMGMVTRLVEVRALDPTDTLAPALLERMRQRDRRVLLGFGAFVPLLLGVLFAYSIFLTHKVAGPLHKIATYMAQIRDGRLGEVQELRRGDQLRLFYETFRQMHGALRERTRADVAALEQAEQLLAQGRASEAAAVLTALRQRRQAELG